MSMVHVVVLGTNHLYVGREVEKFRILHRNSRFCILVPDRRNLPYNSYVNFCPTPSGNRPLNGWSSVESRDFNCRNTSLRIYGVS